ncbi:MAG: GGDEF domain-containing protein [Rhodospirillales bacterium]|nr:GGDEF domain-containing protein [Rhodospirillales bacterium]
MGDEVNRDRPLAGSVRRAERLLREASSTGDFAKAAAFNQDTLAPRLNRLSEEGSSVAPAHKGRIELASGIFAAIAVRDTEIAKGRLATTTQRVLIDRQNEELLGLKSENARLARLAGTDALTGLHNRRSYDEDLLAFVAESRRRLEAHERNPGDTSINDMKLTLFVGDIDDFKKFNDALGHEKGDDALRLTAACMKRAFARPTDRIYRYGGEEMVGLIHDSLSPDQVREKVRDKTDGLVIRNHEGRNPHPISLSIGVISVEGGSPEVQKMLKDQTLSDSEIAKSLFEAADKAMYKDKCDTKQDRLAALREKITPTTQNTPDPNGPQSTPGV